MRTIFLSALMILGFFLVNRSTQAQGIAAGVYDAGDVYTDLVPDSVQKVDISPFSVGWSYEYEVDLDFNGWPDLKFSSGGIGGMGGGSGSCWIQPLASNVEIASRFDTFQICCPVDVIRLVANKFQLQDSISGDDEYHSQPTTLWSASWGATQTPNINEWIDIGERYIGFRICLSVDTLYGWIRVNVTTGSYYETHIMDYACNQNTSAVIDPYNPERVPLFPNPFGNELQFNASTSFPARLILYSAEGKKVFDEIFQDKATVSTDFLSSGIYYYELKNNKNQTLRGKLIRDYP